jgi:hypothetical protein
MTYEEELKLRLVTLMLNLRDALQSPDADPKVVLHNCRAQFERLQADSERRFRVTL